MSETDSFIDEVTEEVRRDRLFGLMRRYGWIAVLAVLLIVGGAAYREYSRASDQSAARALGDALLAALDTEDTDARSSALSLSIISRYCCTSTSRADCVESGLSSEVISACS